jgi:hypothetical protein
MPWVGYEYNNPEPPAAGFLPLSAQIELIGRAVEFYCDFFGSCPRSACAPGFRANEDTREAWWKNGIRIAQNGTGGSIFPTMNARGMLSLYRTLDFEPSESEVSIENCIRFADQHLARGMPLIISVHSINFHSSLRDFRSDTLGQLDRFLSALERKYPDLLYVHDEDVYSLVNQGAFTSAPGTTAVAVKLQETTG